MICNLYLARFPENTIMKMSGHKKYASFKTDINKVMGANYIGVASKLWNKKIPNGDLAIKFVHYMSLFEKLNDNWLIISLQKIKVVPEPCLL